VLVSIHPPVGQITHDFFIPNWPALRTEQRDVLIIAWSAPVAPWQLFFHQSYVSTAHHAAFHEYEKRPVDWHRS